MIGLGYLVWILRLQESAKGSDAATVFAGTAAACVASRRRSRQKSKIMAQVTKMMHT